MVEITPDVAGWSYSSLRVISLKAGGEVAFATEDSEVVVLSLSGSCHIECESLHVELEGRPSPFEGVSDFLYAPPRTSLSMKSQEGGRFAVLGARADTGRSVRYQPKTATCFERRGSGSASRRVANYCTSKTFDAEKIIVVEVVTPGGNWSSYPPHKHDEDRPGESVLEEVYYFEIDGPTVGDPVGYQRVYGTPERPVELMTDVRTGDVVVIPHGWHGPTMAAPGYDLYFLNVMAGPHTREWNICDDPQHSWVRNTWRDEDFDPRAELYTEGETPQ